MSEKKTRVSKRTRNYATVVYPESAPSNWKEILADFCVPAFISPLHDKDINPDGELKKAHYHVLFMFDGVKTSEQAEELFKNIGGVGNEIVQSTRGYARYLCHLDNPEKYQYNKEDVLQFGGADYHALIGLALDKYKAIVEMQDFCDKYDVNSFYMLTKYARVHRFDWFRVLADSSCVFMKEYLKSKVWSNQNKIDCIIDENGEVIL